MPASIPPPPADEAPDDDDVDGRVGIGEEGGGAPEAAEVTGALLMMGERVVGCWSVG